MSDYCSTSFIIPHYNDVCTIETTISHLIQLTKNSAFIRVIDDGSSLEVIQKLEVLLKKYPMVNLIKKKVNRGIGSIVNEELRAVITPFVGFVSANDYYLDTNYFRLAIKKLERKSVGLCFAKAKLKDSIDGSERGIIGWAPRKNTIISPAEFRQAVFQSRINLPGATVIGRTSMLRAVPFDPNQGPQMDSFCYQTIGMLAGAYYHHKVVAVCSENSKSLTNNQNIETWVKSFVLACRHWHSLALLPSKNNAVFAWLQHQCKSYLESSGASGDPIKIAKEIYLMSEIR